MSKTHINENATRRAPPPPPPPKTSPYLSRTPTPVSHVLSPPPTRLKPVPVVAERMSPPPVAQRLEGRFHVPGASPPQRDSHMHVHDGSHQLRSVSPPLNRPIPHVISAPQRAQEPSGGGTAYASQATPHQDVLLHRSVGQSAHDDRPARKARSLPDTTSVPDLQPTGRAAAASSAAALPLPTLAVSHQPPAQQQSTQPVLTPTLASNASTAIAHSAALESAATAASCEPHAITIVVKGVCSSAGPPAPAPRVVELSCRRTAAVDAVILLCLETLCGTSADAKARFELDGFAIEQAELEQNGRTLPRDSLLEQVSKPDELYFLSLVYSRLSAHPDPTASAPPHGSNSSTTRISALEERIAAVECFVRERSRSPLNRQSGLQVDHTADLAALKMSPIAANPQPFAQANDATFASDTAVQPLEGLSYSARARQIEFLSLNSRQQRYEKILELKAMIAECVEQCRWMEVHLDDRTDDIADRDVRGGSPRAVNSGVATKLLTRQRTAAYPITSKPAGPADQPDNVRVDYDPVLDIWRLRKTS